MAQLCNLGQDCCGKWCWGFPPLCSGAALKLRHLPGSLPELCCRWACAWPCTSLILIRTPDLLTWLLDSPTLFARSLSGNQWAFGWCGLLSRDLFWVLWDSARSWWGHCPACFAVTLSSCLISFEEQPILAAPWHSNPLVLGILTCGNRTFTVACCRGRAM